MIEDWEIGQLFRNCLKKAQDKGVIDEQEAELIALEKVKEKYFDDFVANKDLYFFLGTTKKWHTMRSLNPFVIIGIFYPMKETQGRLF